jgi:hypothetical protein
MKKLRQLLSQEDTVLFIGSGISMWSGLPSWTHFIEELANFVEVTGANAGLVREEAVRGDLLQAASFGFDSLTKQQIGDFVRSACRYGIAKPQEIHRKIVSLGPRCFITTNYDNLVEESLRLWQPDRFYRPPVTNRQLTEMGEIIHARAIDFIFKPHGDAADSDSIILTREQYRQLLPDGERHAAFDSLKMLLASRPVVYLGFSLRDPDFVYLRDLLSNTYKGGTRDHYAIMPDVSDGERDYWRRNYGIHLISYKTENDISGGTDHSALLSLLDGLLDEFETPSEKTPFDPRAPEVVLALARHAAGLLHIAKLDPEFTIRVRLETDEKSRENQLFSRPHAFDYSTVEKLLDSGPSRLLLVGLPGAGKTYSLRRAAARSAEKLHEQCLSESFGADDVVVPLFADLKLYRGSLRDLIDESLPKTLPLDEMTKHYHVKIMFDSFNEMPREYRESGAYESDFANFVGGVGETAFIIGSRTTDGLTKLAFPAYHLDLIDQDTVTAELERLGINIDGRFKNDVKSILQRPFYFRYVSSGAVRLPKEPHPRDFYRIWLENLNQTFASRFDIQFNLELTLSVTAYDALNRGEEAFPLSDLLNILNDEIRRNGATINDRDIANWLVATSILIPHSGGRVTFVHQSLTEYLAAAELARRYQTIPHILKDKLSLTRWDQALFLTLGLLGPKESEAFLDDIIRADFLLALTAAKYLEVSRDEAVTVLLSRMLKYCRSSESTEPRMSIPRDLPVTSIHEPQLRELLSCQESVAASAAVRLLDLKGLEVKEELLLLLRTRSGDFNFGGEVGAALRPFAIEADIKRIVDWTDSIERSLSKTKRFEDLEEDHFDGFTHGAAEFLSGLDLSSLYKAFFPREVMNFGGLRAEILCSILYEHRSTEALNLAGQLLLLGAEEAAFPIHAIGGFSELNPTLDWSSFNTCHVDRLLLMFESDESWAESALKTLCAARPDLAQVVRTAALMTTGLKRALLLLCVDPTDFEPVFKTLTELSESHVEMRDEHTIGLLPRMWLDWRGKEELFVRLLKKRDKSLARSLLGHVIPVSIQNLGLIEIGDIEWWLLWIQELSEGDYWVAEQLASLFGDYVSREKQAEAVAEFNRPTSKFRRVLQFYVLPFLNDLTTDDLSEDSISLLLADLERENSTSWFYGHLLGRVATEQFVSDRLLPLRDEGNSTFAKNLRAVLRGAGSRHGRRYIVE